MRHLTSSLLLGIACSAFAQTPATSPIVPDSSEIGSAVNTAKSMLDDNIELLDSFASDSIIFKPVVIRDLDEILAALPDTMPERPYNPMLGPWVFSGYRSLKHRSFNDISDNSNQKSQYLQSSSDVKPYRPAWLYNALTQSRISQDYMYYSMVYNPTSVDYTYWDLPVPPRLPEDDVSLGAYIRNLNLPEVAVEDALLPEFEQKKKPWLHKFNTGLQFSQAYVSKNWYQGGNNYLALLYNFYWDVQLNPTYHPNQIFQSTVNYKLGINSIEQNAVGRKYSISEDNFQYNVKYGFKAFKKWFYTVTGQFKTQFFNNYKTNTDIRSASFLSPADLNVGIGMTYSYANPKKTFNLTASIAPLSYNLKVCIDPNIDHAQFNIDPDKKTHSEFGSSGEANMTWQVTSNISMRTRVFAFTDYSYFQGNVETTWDFAINKFLSTQIYANLRYDSSSDFNLSKWHHWMLKEILSFGLSYTFSTK
ncbi:MAG: DUF3078 domain-containing protein [Muribaculaceae bacterium]|nr:DUF3078 domain-containing protein [Muribaculaceae bacterium]